MCGTSVLDKDGISAAMVVMEMTSQLARKGVTLVGQLDNIYERSVDLFPRNSISSVKLANVAYKNYL